MVICEWEDDGGINKNNSGQRHAIARNICAILTCSLTAPDHGADDDAGE